MLVQLQSRKPQTGFTLLEVLVAIAVFSMVALISYSTLDTYIDQRERLTEHYGKLERLQRVFILLERDIQYVINRKVRNGNDIEAAVESADGDTFISMTVAESDINSETGISLKRVQWRLDGSDMIRSSWDVLDQEGELDPSEFVVSDEVDNIDLTYLLYDPNSGVDELSSLKDDQYPDGIEVNLQLKSGEKYRRVFGLARGSTSSANNASSSN